MFNLEEALAALEEWGSPDELWPATPDDHTVSSEAALFIWWQTAVGVLDTVHYVQSTLDPEMAAQAYDGATKLLQHGGLERRPALPPLDERPRFENQVREQGWFQWEPRGAWHYGPPAPAWPDPQNPAQEIWLAQAHDLRSTCRNEVPFEPFSRIVLVPAVAGEPRRREVVVNVLRDVLRDRATKGATIRQQLQTEADTFHAIAELESDPAEVSLARHLADQALSALQKQRE